MPEIYLVLHNIRSLYNVGSLFRTADGAGVTRMFLTGYTGTPPRKEIKKTALGAEDNVPWEHDWDIDAVLQKLKNQGVQIVGVECSPESQHYMDIGYQSPVALVLGNEVTGVEDEVRAYCDVVAHVPMHGIKESLNVSVCGGVLLYGLRHVFNTKGRA